MALRKVVTLMSGRMRLSKRHMRWSKHLFRACCIARHEDDDDVYLLISYLQTEFIHFPNFSSNY